MDLSNLKPAEGSIKKGKRIGRGQVILFAGEPNFRGAALGTNRLWLNAVVYGSGLGTSARIVP